MGIDGKTCKSLEQARDLAKGIVTGRDKMYNRLALAAQVLGVPHVHPKIIATWKAAGEQTLDQFAPYAAFVLSIEIFFRFALAANLIATERPSNRTDIAYLFYLPFCTLFISSDNLHRKCAPLHAANQEFIWGIDLKPALFQVNATFAELSEAEKEKGVMTFGRSPPEGNLVAELWDRHMRKGYREDPPSVRDPVKDAELVKKLKAFAKEPTLLQGEADERRDDMLTISRTISRKRELVASAERLEG